MLTDEAHRNTAEPIRKQEPRVFCQRVLLECLDWLNILAYVYMLETLHIYLLV